MMRLGKSLLVASAALFGACSHPIVLEWTFENASGSVSTPLVTDQFIAFGSDTGLTILEPGGAPRCVFDSNGEVISAPRTDGKLIFFGSTNYLFYAIEPSCKLVWKFSTGDRIKSDPLIVDGRVYTSSYDGHVYALEATTGKQIWMFPGGQPARQIEGQQAGAGAAGAPSDSAPAASEETGKRGKGKNARGVAQQRRKGPPRERKGGKGARKGGKDGGRDVAGKDAKGEVAGAGTTASAATAASGGSAGTGAAGPFEVGDFSYSSPTLADGVLYIGNLDHNLYALNAADGTLRWTFATQGPVTSSPVVKDGFIYFGSNDGHLYAVTLSTQKLAWRMPTQDWVNSSPRIIDNTIYIGSNDRYLYSVDLPTGAPKWKYQAEGPVITIPAIYQNLAFFGGGSGDGTFYAVDLESHSLFWSFKTKGKIESDPIIVGDKIYLTCSDRMLYVFRIVRTTAG